MGWSQLPDIIIQPKDGKGKDYFVESRKNDLTLKGVLGLAFLGLSVVVSYYTFSTDYWFMGVVLMVLVIVYFGWAIFTSQRPRT